MAARGQNSPRIFWLASLMFFLSGGTGLAYQVIWFKRFAHVWGSSSLAFASVGGSFLFGLGLGACLIGRRTDRLAAPLRWYGLAELAIGVLALVIPFEIQWLIELSAGFYSKLPEDPIWRYLVQFAVTLIVVGPPCVLMGGTLPLLIRQLTARDGSLDQATGWLYAINTFGAAGGCFLAGFALLPKIGLLWTNNLCAALNIAIGLVAVMVSTQTTRRKQPAAEVKPTAAETFGWDFALIGLYVAVMLSGLGALILEMTWSRQLALVLGGSTYAYSATLFVVLLGIALGSLIFHLGLRSIASNPWLPVAVIGVLVGSCLIGKLSLPQLSLLAANLRAYRGTLHGNAGVCALASLLLEFVPAVAMGILFPLFVHLTRETAAAVGRAVGDVYAWNTLGSILGASLTAVLLFPRIGTAGSVALATALYILALLLVLPMRRPRELVVGVACLVAGGGAVAAIAMPQDPFTTNMGMYMYGDRRDTFKSLTQLYFAEGASSNVLVANTNGQSVSLRVNGKVDASDGLDMHTQLGLAYFPRMFRPDAKNVLVIGFGSGTTSGTSLLFPDTRVTCCEIEPAVYQASKFFAHINHRPQEKSREFLLEKRLKELGPGQRLSPSDLEQIDREARFSVIFGDGRSTLQGSDKKYDIIISEPSNPWIAGVSNLFTREFFEAAHAHLTEGGVLAQWIQTYNFTWSDYMMIVRTLRQVFPHCGMVIVAQGADTILLASNQPLMPNQRAIQSLQQVVDASPEILADLRKWFATTDLRIILMRHYKGDEASLVRSVDQEKLRHINTDLNLRLEFDAPRHLFEKLDPSETAQVKIQSLGSDGWRNQLGAALGIQPNSAEYQILLAEQESAAKHYDKALAHYQDALAINPRLAEAYRGAAAIHVHLKKHESAVAVLKDLLKFHPGDIEASRALATQLFTLKRGDEAADVLRTILDQAPNDLDAIDKLASYLITVNRPTEALPYLERLAVQQPTNANVHGNLASAYLAAKRFDLAVAHFRKALDLKPLRKPSGTDETKQDLSNVVWANNLAWLLATCADSRLRNGKEAVQLATAACEAVGYKVEFVDTLAAAHAEAGQFDEAVKFGQQFLDQAELTKPELVKAGKERLELYRAHQPFRES